MVIRCYVRKQSRTYQKCLKIMQNSSKIYQNQSKINQKFIKISSWASRGPKTLPRPLKPENGRKTHPSGLHFGRLFSIMLAPRATKSLFKINTKFCFTWQSIFHRFFIDFGRFLDGSWTQVCIENRLKIGSRC